MIIIFINFILLNVLISFTRLMMHNTKLINRWTVRFSQWALQVSDAHLYILKEELTLVFYSLLTANWLVSRVRVK